MLMEYPVEVEKFLAEVRAHLGELSPNIEKTLGGYWWIDFNGARHLAVEWRPGRGFGLSATSSTFGEGPAEVFVTAARAAKRVAQILKPKAGSRVPTLASVRELYGMTQTQLGRKLAKGQPAISQIEKGRDSKIETVDAYIRGLGGQMEIRAVFRDGFVAIPLCKMTGSRGGSIKPARAAGR